MIIKRYLVTLRNTFQKPSKRDFCLKKYTHCMIEKYHLRKCTKKCGLGQATIFFIDDIKFWMLFKT